MPILLASSVAVMKRVRTVTLLLMLSQHVLAGNDLQEGIQLFHSLEFDKSLSFFKARKSQFKQDPEFQYYYGLSLYKTDHAKQAIEQM